MKYSDYSCNILVARNGIFSRNRKTKIGMCCKQVIEIGDFTYKISYDEDTELFKWTIDINQPDFDIKFDDAFLTKRDMNDIADVIRDVRASIPKKPICAKLMLPGRNKSPITFFSVVGEDGDIDDWSVRIEIKRDIHIILHAGEIINLCEYLTDIQHYL